ncbi:hypothetical protein K1719_026284 [Acacia pycnantha]|nr:hypothetical protein K1719_026284 [Acacia pycnantha]
MILFVLHFFASNGFPFPAVKNPSNHFLKTINKDFDDQESGIVEKKRGHANFQTQCIVLAKRSSVNMRRDVGYYWLRLGIYIIVALDLATVFYDLGMSMESIQGRNNSILENALRLY